ncbi:MAG TPA: hypothetical protein DCX06_02440 [Opitutae bacterium]|nr:hypothetical protein [Opitutae bacterium]
MNGEVNERINDLLDKGASGAKRKAALKYLGEVLEEDYILNLPPQRPILKALDTVSRRANIEPVVKSKAKKLIKEYGL